MNQLEIITEAANEANIPREQMEKIVSDFWKGIRKMIASPVESLGSILIETFGKFYIKEYTVQKRIDSLGRTKVSEERLEEYKKLQQTLKNGQRQKRKNSNS